MRTVKAASTMIQALSAMSLATNVKAARSAGASLTLTSANGKVMRRKVQMDQAKVKAQMDQKDQMLPREREKVTPLKKEEMLQEMMHQQEMSQLEKMPVMHH